MCILRVCLYVYRNEFRNTISEVNTVPPVIMVGVIVG